MTEVRQLELLEEACAEHDRLAVALAAARAAQERILAELLDGLHDRLQAAASDLRFAVDGARAHGVALERSLFLVVDEERSWALLERHAHGTQAVVKRVTVGALLDALGRGAARVVLEALTAAERSAAARLPASVAPARTVLPKGRTRACPECDAHPNEENYARHLRTIHGLGVDGARATQLRPTTSAGHQVCRLCGARLPSGRLDPHLTAMHGIFHVHPHGDREESRREATRRVTRPRAIANVRTNAPVASGRPARDFLAETRHERTLVARSDSPHRDRDRQGRFSDAPDVERMDGDSRS